MDSWVMHDADDGVTAPQSVHWTPEDDELMRQIARENVQMLEFAREQEDDEQMREIEREQELGNVEKVQKLMDELNKQNREKGIDVEYYTPGEGSWK